MTLLKKRVTLGRIKHYEDRAEYLRDQYLRQRGWVHSSNHPGGLWLWIKTIDGKDYHCDTSHAMHVQDAWEFLNKQATR